MHKTRIVGNHHPASTTDDDDGGNKMQQQDKLNLQLPDGFRVLATQVAGHTFQKDAADALGLLQDATTGCVLKPLGKPDCGQRELGFYESLQLQSTTTADANNDSSTATAVTTTAATAFTKAPAAACAFLQQARALVPLFHRKLLLSVNGREHMFLQLEDVTHGLRRPCIMDIKVGQRTWDPLASAQKRAVEQQKYAACKQPLGLCVPGFQVYRRPDGQVLRQGKDYGKRLDAAGLRATLALFLNAAQPPLAPVVCAALVREVLRQLHEIRRWFSVQTRLHFYASSLLIAYDFDELQRQLAQEGANTAPPLTNGNAQGDGVVDDAISPADEARRWVRVKMIDFAHVFPAESGALDANYLFGLENLIAIFEALLLQ